MILKNDDGLFVKFTDLTKLFKIIRNIEMQQLL